jgi:site-specific DNA recombinase
VWASRCGCADPSATRWTATLRADEAKLVQDAYEELLKGKSIGSIYRSWNAAGYRTTAPTPGEWNHHAFRVLITAARNAGILVRHGEEIGPGNWAAIVGQPTFRAVQRYLLAGIAVCDVCDATVRSRNVKWGDYDKVYCCRLGHISVPMEWADGVVLRRLVEEAVRRGQSTFGYDEGAAHIDVAPLNERKRQIGELLTELGEDRAANLISREEQHAGSKMLRGELEQIDEQLMAADKAARWDYVDVEHLYEEFDGFDVERQRELIDQAFAGIRFKIRQYGSGHRAYKDGLPSDLIFTAPH